MKKNGMVKRFLTVLLPVIAVIWLTMQGTLVFAETLQPELQGETTEEQQESQGETLEEGKFDEQTESEEPELTEEQTDTVPEHSVSGNDISEEESEDPDGTIDVPAGEDAGTGNELRLTDEILKNCIVSGMNPQGVTVNLFDYSQGVIPDGSREVAHDYYYDWHGLDVNNNESAPNIESDKYVNTYNLGISENHLLRFGYRGYEKYDYCITTKDGKALGDYGAWNEYRTVRYPGIVQNKLYNGYPRLKLDVLKEADFGRYADANNAAYLSGDKKIESLAYLFSPNVQNQYKTSYSAVQGLFQQGADGYYYYNSRENFARFNKNTNSFTLYNSPGVANVVNGQVYSGQFFPFNKITDVFDDYYKDGDDYRLTYRNTANKNDGSDGYTENNYEPIGVDNYGHGYIKCYAPDLNHYLGLTLEMSFVQPAGGCVTGSTDGSEPMIFSFSGDDDVWIFIDDVLVADLGGLHDALGLSINFASGEVNVDGSNPYYLYDSFVNAYGENSIPSGIKFNEENGNTFADNTTHTLKMFYLERGHMASNLSLSFNIQPLPSPPDDGEVIEEEDGDEEDEDEEHSSDSDTHPVVEMPVSDNTLYDIVEIPETGDDSMIEWWAALCIISLVGIGATVCNLIIRKRKKDK